MTALHIDERTPRPGSARLRTVPQGVAAAYAPAVRPDRPHSRRGALHAVLTPPSADGIDVTAHWVTQPVARPARAPERKPLDRSQVSAAIRAHERRVYYGVSSALTVIGMVMAFALGIFLYAALGFGLQAGDAITVVSGDTLWSIATAMGVELPTVQVVRDISELNALDGGSIVAGMELVLPAY